MTPRKRPASTALALPDQHAGTIRQSHERCMALGLSRIERPDHAPLGRPELRQVRERHHRLHAHAAPVMEMLFGQIQGTQSMVVLCDSAGTIIHSIGDDDFLSRASKVALQPGVNWSEPAKGTNAIGTALIEELPTLVHADEHYMHANHFLTCSAAPIVDPRGNVLGVLDVTGDHRSYHPHTMALVKLSARMIENHWLRDDHRHALRIHFHHRADFIGTLMEGILAVSPEGRVVGANRGALELLGLPGAALRRLDVQALFGLPVAVLVDRFRASRAEPLATSGPQRRVFHVLARFSGPGWGSGTRAAVAGAAAVAADARAHGVRDAGSDPPADASAAAQPAPRASALQALLTGDAQMAALVDKLRRVLPHAVPVVLVGETGSGKNLLARALHQDSPRAGGPLVVLGCAAADTQSLQDAVQQALGGTLVLDGVAELAPPLQALLLHLLQQPGCALVSTTLQPLQPGSGLGQLREDLFHRLQGLGVRLPPLRERSDLAALARQALEGLHPLDAQGPAAAQAVAPPALQLSRGALALLQAHAWPGNVRQLHTVLRTAALLAVPHGAIDESHLPEDWRGAPGAAPALVPAASLGQIEQQAMQQALTAARGNVSAAARQLGVSRNTLYRRLRWGAAAKS
jgi:sigma-54 dependent transcriptional regulator, acetoin dehydrogenase operon transcriptional activator AcoR